VCHDDRTALLVLTVLFGIGFLFALLALAAALFALSRQKKNHKKRKIPRTCANCNMPFEACGCAPPGQDS
jgi:hypothetical protein